MLVGGAREGEARASFLGDTESLGDLRDLALSEDFFLAEEDPRDVFFKEERLGDFVRISWSLTGGEVSFA